MTADLPQVAARGVGEFVMLSSARPASIALDGAPAKFGYDAERSRLCVELPQGAPLDHTLLVSF